MRLHAESKLLFKLWLKDPLKIGAVVPSSRELAEAMARLVPARRRFPVIELGAGTGVVTDALLEAGVASADLVAVERDLTLYRLLLERYPNLRIVQGDAASLVGVVKTVGVEHASAVVSSLPILSMRKPVQQAIVEQSFAVLEPGAPFIQFTYGLFSPLPRREFGLSGQVEDRIFNNLPPASVWLYRRRGEQMNGHPIG